MMCSTDRSESAASRSSRKGTPALARRTNAPFPWCDSTSPSDFSRDTASRTTVRLTPNRSAISFSDGSRDSGANAPARTSFMSSSVTWSVSVPRGRSIFRSRVAGMGTAKP